MKPLSAPVLIALLTTALLPRTAPAQQPAPPDLGALVQQLGSKVAWRADDPLRLREGNRSEYREVRASARAAKDFDRPGALAAARTEAWQSGRLVLWYVPRIQGPQMYRPAVLDGYMKAVPFSDPDCVDIINRRFVPVRLVCDTTLRALTGIEAPEVVEPALVFMRPDGHIVHRVDRISSFSAEWFAELLRGVLRAHPEHATPSAESATARKAMDGSTASRLALARELQRDGDWEEARSILEPALGAPDSKLRLQAQLDGAGLQRRLGELDACLKTLEQIAGDEDADRMAHEAACERGRALLAAGLVHEAAVTLGEVRRGPRRTEALYFAGVCDFLLGDSAFATRRFKEAATLDDADPYAWKAAANILEGPDRTPVGPLLHGFEHVFRVEVPDALPRNSVVVRGPGETSTISRDAVDFLLRMQRANGAWSDSRYAYWPAPDLTPNVWVAQTALACAALLEWRDLAPEAIDRALARGEAYIFDERHMARGFNEEIYADAYKLLYLCRKIDLSADAAERDAARGRMNAVIRTLMPTQGQSGRGEGFWAHEYPNPFCTAAVMNSLELARERGATVPSAMMRRGAAALVRVRDDDTGAFAYGARPRPSSPKDSMARSPICETAITWAGSDRGSPERVSRALANFWKYLPRLERIRKCDFHTDGELGGFFFWHGIFHTTEAIKSLPEPERSAHQRRMLEFLVTLGELDGSFVDSHEQGKSYGTAMALLALRNVLGPEEP
jgi:hypothetical protein